MTKSVSNCEACGLKHPNRDCFRTGERVFIGYNEQQNGTVKDSDRNGVYVVPDDNPEIELICDPLFLGPERTDSYLGCPTPDQCFHESH